MDDSTQYARTDFWVLPRGAGSATATIVFAPNSESRTRQIFLSELPEAPSGLADSLISSARTTMAAAVGRSHERLAVGMLWNEALLASPGFESVGLDYGIAVWEVAIGSPEELSLEAVRPLFEEAALELVPGSGASDSLVYEAQRSWVAVLFNLGESELAIEPQRRLIEFLDTWSGAPELSRLVAGRDMGDVLLNSNRIDQAIEAYEETLARFPSLLASDPTAEADLLISLGEALRLQGRHRESEAAIRAAVKSIDRAATAENLPGNQETKATVLLSLGGMLYDHERYREAGVAYRECLQAARTPGVDSLNLMLALMNVGEIERIAGRYEAAQEYFDQAIEVSQSLPSPCVRCWSLYNQIGELLRDQNDMPGALEWVRRSVETLKSSSEGTAFLCAPILRSAECLAALDRTHESEAAFTEALEMATVQYGVDSPDYALLLASIGKHQIDRDEAKQLLRRSVQILSRANVYPGHRSEARAGLARLLWQDGDRVSSIALMEEAVGDLEHLRQTSSAEPIVRATFFADHADAFRDLTSWLADSGDVHRAFATAEKFRARSLLESFSLRGDGVWTGVDESTRVDLESREDAALQAYTLTRRRLQLYYVESKHPRDPDREVQLQDACARAYAVLAAVRSEIREHSPLSRRVLTTAGNLVSLEEFQQGVLADDETFLMYQVGAKSSHVFVVERGFAAVFPLVISSKSADLLDCTEGPLTREILRQLILGKDAGGAGLLGQIQTREDRHTRAASEFGPARSLAAKAEGSSSSAHMLKRLHALYKVLLPAQIQARIEPTGHFIVVPDGPLHRLPLELLVSEIDEAGHPTFLLQSGPTLRYAPSATVLSRLTRLAKDRVPIGWGSRVLVMGDPIFDAAIRKPTMISSGAGADARGGIKPLPFSRVEAEDIHAFFPASESMLLIGKEASEGNLRRYAGNRSIIHLATHGIATQRRGYVTAYLALARAFTDGDDPRDDGFLEITEIPEIPISADLVVLSACDSHGGVWLDGEGAMALSGAFLAAGGHRVIGSLWQARDDTTVGLMRDFYAGLAQVRSRDQQVIPAELLRAAKQKALTNGVSVADWGLFVLSGAR